MQLKNLKILLLQLRKDPEMQEHEQNCVLRSSGLEKNQLKAINGLEESFSLQNLRDKHLLVIGGSGDYSIFDDLPFRQALSEVLAWARTTNFPVLGSCWGGEFMAEIFGGRAETNKDMEEVGTFEMEKLEAAKNDPLFYDFPRNFLAQVGHHESIVLQPTGAVILIKSKKCPIQAFTWQGSAQYGLQFHPELGKDDVRRRILHYKTSYAGKAENLDKMLAGLADSPLTENLIAKFIDRIVLPRYN